jgi:hypothetical protein
MDNQAKAFDFALSTTKQVVSLSTGILALTVTFFKDIVSEAGDAAVYALVLSWVLFLVSLIAGVVTMMSLAGYLEQTEDKEQLSIYEGPIRIYSGVQITAFLFGMLSAVAFGILGIL